MMYYFLNVHKGQNFIAEFITITRRKGKSLKWTSFIILAAFNVVSFPASFRSLIPDQVPIAAQILTLSVRHPSGVEVPIVSSALLLLILTPFAEGIMGHTTLIPKVSFLYGIGQVLPVVATSPIGGV